MTAHSFYPKYIWSYFQQSQHFQLTGIKSKRTMVFSKLKSLFENNKNNVKFHDRCMDISITQASEGEEEDRKNDDDENLKDQPKTDRDKQHVVQNIRRRPNNERHTYSPWFPRGYKIDLRIYVLVTSFKPLVIYIYQEGLTRFATVKYRNDNANLHALRMHLTNFSINVNSGNYIKNDDPSIEDFGSKWTLSALLRYFQANGIDTVGVECYDKKKPRQCRTIDQLVLNYLHLKQCCSAKELQHLERRRARFWKNLTRREQKMITRVRNDEKRAGGWIRIFPVVDSWEKYNTGQSRMSSYTMVFILLRIDTGHAGHAEADEEIPDKPGNYCGGDEIVLEEALRKRLLGQITKGYLLTEVQARILFMRYLTNLKQILRECQQAPDIRTCPPLSVIKDLLYQFLGQCSNLIIDKTKSKAEYYLDTCLTNFLYYYHKETRQLMLRGETSLKATGEPAHETKQDREFVSLDLFEEFIHSADPWEIEELLLDYFKIHGDDKLFLRDPIRIILPANKHFKERSKDASISEDRITAMPERMPHINREEIP
ncbi:tubulin polyglutamylase ttll5 [Plakobranchus ocellatus]|uniref:Tubulin--tyrosine ligase-like protein 5 n=1 Tax=Plakobranchus ocellatus TaxID=259542 RepID=A0AAV4BKV3_9GAST|nr:tubulin polyglutamylase ttll5 [Plakobranchus ocellatus]